MIPWQLQYKKEMIIVNCESISSLIAIFIYLFINNNLLSSESESFFFFAFSNANWNAKQSSEMNWNENLWRDTRGQRLVPERALRGNKSENDVQFSVCVRSPVKLCTPINFFTAHITHTHLLDHDGDQYNMNNMNKLIYWQQRCMQPKSVCGREGSNALCEGNHWHTRIHDDALVPITYILVCFCCC